MGKIKSTNNQLCAVVPQTISQVVAERARDLTMTKSKYTSLIVRWWANQGFPPVIPADEAMQVFKKGGKK